MSENYGGKIQKLAKILMIVACIAWGIAGIFILIRLVNQATVTSIYYGTVIHPGYAILYIFLGMLAIAFGYFIIYFVYHLFLGFGRLVENSDLIVKKTGAEELRNQAGQSVKASVDKVEPATSIEYDLSGTKVIMPTKLLNTATSDLDKTDFSEAKNNPVTINVSDNEEPSKEDDKPENRVCSKCGAPIKEDAQFCFKCGNIL